MGEPGIQPLEGCGEAAGEDGLLEAGAFAFQLFRRDVGVVERFQQLDRGVLREVQLVPAGGRVGSFGLGIQGDAEFAGEEDGHEGGLKL